jgi:hypothetical protein
MHMLQDMISYFTIEVPRILMPTTITVFSSAVFVLECLIRVFAYGFFLDKLSYLRRSSANFFDFGIVVAG